MGNLAVNSMAAAGMISSDSEERRSHWDIDGGDGRDTLDFSDHVIAVVVLTGSTADGYADRGLRFQRRRLPGRRLRSSDTRGTTTAIRSSVRDTASLP